MMPVQHLQTIIPSWIDGYMPPNSLWKYIPINEKRKFKDLIAQLPKDERIKLNTEVQHIMKKHMVSRNILESLKESLDEIKYDMEKECIEEDVVRPFSYTWMQTYDNKNYMKDICYLSSECRKLDRNEYHEEPVLYIGILGIKDPLNKNRIIIKIGFSDNIWKRIKTLKTEYGCDFELLGLKKIFQESDEQQFHTELKKEFPHLIVDIQIKNQNKTEVYVYDREIYERFLEFVPRNVKNKIDEKEERKLDKYFVDSNKRLQNYFQNLENNDEQPKPKKRKLNTI